MDYIYFGSLFPKVKICVENNIPFLATGGGHGAGTGYGTVKNAVNIDLGNFRSVGLDVERNLLTVGGATLAGQIYGPLYAAGKELRTKHPHQFPFDYTAAKTRSVRAL